MASKKKKGSTRKPAAMVKSDKVLETPAVGKNDSALSPSMPQALKSSSFIVPEKRVETEDTLPQQTLVNEKIVERSEKPSKASDGSNDIHNPQLVAILQAGIECLKAEKAFLETSLGMKQAAIKHTENKVKEKDSLLKESDTKVKMKDNLLKESEDKVKEKDNLLKKSEDKVRENEAKVKEKDNLLRKCENKFKLKDNFLKKVKDEVKEKEAADKLRRTEIKNLSNEKAALKEQIQNYTAKLHATEESLKAQVKHKGVINNQHNLEVKSLKSEMAELEKKLKARENKLDDQEIEYEIELGEKNAVAMKMEEILLCGVCLSVPRSQRIPVCSNGHITCQACKGQICPICRVATRVARFSVVASNIADLLELECINQGCTVRKHRNQLVQHENSCLYKMDIICPIDVRCKMLSYHNVMNHLELAHGSFVHHFQLDKPFYRYMKMDGEVVSNKLVFPGRVSLTDDHVMMVAEIKGEFVMIAFRCLSADKPRRYKVEFQLLDSKTGQSFSNSGETMIMAESLQDGLNAGNVLVVHQGAYAKCLAGGEMKIVFTLKQIRQVISNGKEAGLASLGGMNKGLTASVADGSNSGVNKIINTSSAANKVGGMDKGAGAGGSNTSGPSCSNKAVNKGLDTSGPSGSNKAVNKGLGTSGAGGSKKGVNKGLDTSGPIGSNKGVNKGLVTSGPSGSNKVVNKGLDASGAGGSNKGVNKGLENSGFIDEWDNFMRQEWERIYMRPDTSVAVGSDKGVNKGLNTSGAGGSNKGVNKGLDTSTGVLDEWDHIFTPKSAKKDLNIFGGGSKGNMSRGSSSVDGGNTNREDWFCGNPTPSGSGVKRKLEKATENGDGNKKAK